MPLEPHLERLLASPPPDPGEELRREAFTLGRMDALQEHNRWNLGLDIERRQEWREMAAGHEGDLGAQVLLDAGQRLVDTALEREFDGRAVRNALERFYEQAKAELEDEDELAEVEEQRRLGYEDGCRRLDQAALARTRASLEAFERLSLVCGS